MPETYKYLSEEWRVEAEKKLRELQTETLKNMTITMANCYLNCPDGKNRYTYTDIKDGRLDGLAIGEGEAPDADFRVIADYNVFVQIAKDEITGQAALMGGKLKIKGNMLKAMKFAPVSDKITKTLASIPAEY
jgi:putative sterol carrier protein